MSAPILVPVRDHTKLQNIGTNTHAEIDTGITKLAGIEADADKTDATNVAAAGAIMDGDIINGGEFT